jgi:hypothetical protein
MGTLTPERVVWLLASTEVSFWRIVPENSFEIDRRSDGASRRETARPPITPIFPSETCVTNTNLDSLGLCSHHFRLLNGNRKLRFPEMRKLCADDTTKSRSHDFV